MTPPPAPPDDSLPDPDDRRALAAALRLLAARDLSRAEVCARLLRRGVTAEAAARVVDRLAREGAIDDRRIARVRATSALRKHRGAGRAERELAKSGIPPAVAHGVVAEVFGATDEHALVEGALARRLKTDRIASPAEFRRLHAYLVRQGFSPAAILAVLRPRFRGRVDPGDDAPE